MNEIFRFIYKFIGWYAEQYSYIDNEYLRTLTVYDYKKYY